MPQIKPITDLCDTNTFSDWCHKIGEPVILTKNGTADLVVMSMETYEAMTETSAMDAAIFAAEADIAQGAQLHDAREALSALREKHFH